jgi:hypothetical protein
LLPGLASRPRFHRLIGHRQTGVVVDHLGTTGVGWVPPGQPVSTNAELPRGGWLCFAGLRGLGRRAAERRESGSGQPLHQPGWVSWANSSQPEPDFGGWRASAWSGVLSSTRFSSIEQPRLVHHLLQPTELLSAATTPSSGSRFPAGGRTGPGRQLRSQRDRWRRLGECLRGLKSGGVPPRIPLSHRAPTELESSAAAWGQLR